MTALRFSILALAALALPISAAAQQAAGSEAVAAGDWGPFAEPDFPFFGTPLDARSVWEAEEGAPADNLTPRGIALRLGEDCWAVFDPDLLRVAAIWRGEGVSMDGMAPGSYHLGTAGKKAPAGQGALPRPLGDLIAALPLAPGWTAEANGGVPDFSDPRDPCPDEKETSRGPLPPERGRFGSIRDEGAFATLRYRVGKSEIAESVDAVARAGQAIVLRRIEVPRLSDPLWAAVAQKGGGLQVAAIGGGAIVEAGDLVACQFDAGPARKAMIAIRRGDPFSEAELADLERAPLPPERLPGSRWSETVTTKIIRDVGRDGNPKSPATAKGFVLDRIELPFDNPWRRNVRVTGIGFFDGGHKAAVCTFDGDIWTAEISDSESEVRWRRIGSGFNEPQSLSVVGGKIYIFDRSGIVRLQLGAGDTQVQTYESFCALPPQTAETREFAMSMVPKPGGGFYLSKGGQVAAHQGKLNGTVVEVAADGQSYRVIATGLRQSYLGFEPKRGWLTSSDQQGNWVPATPIHRIVEGNYYGFLQALGGSGNDHPHPIAEPLFWIPHRINSSGAIQVGVPDGALGPLGGGLIHLSYFKPAIFKLFIDDAAEPVQGGAAMLTNEIWFPPLKGAFNGRDRCLYLAGFRLWGSESPDVAGIARLRDTGTPAGAIADARSERRGVLLRFDAPLHPEVAARPENYRIERWNYLRTEKYGSGDYRLDGTPGREPLAASSAYLSADGMSVFLGIAGMEPCHQLGVGWTVADQDLNPLKGEAFLTVHALRDIDLAAAGFGEIEVDLTPRAVAVAPAGEPEKPTAEAGRKLYEAIGCMACHSTDGTMEGKTGPSWKGLFGSERALVGGGKAKADRKYLRESILDPGAKVAAGFEPKEGIGMPPYAGVLNDAQIESLILYIQSLRQP